LRFQHRQPLILKDSGMPDFSLGPRDQEDLITYIFSLRQN